MADEILQVYDANHQDYVARFNLQEIDANRISVCTVLFHMHSYSLLFCSVCFVLFASSVINHF